MHVGWMITDFLKSKNKAAMQMQQMFQILFCNFHLVIPAEVTDIQFFQNDNQDKCNGTRRVQWQEIDTGFCLVKYIIQFIDDSGNRRNVSSITGHFYCTNEYDNATSIILWATFGGRQGAVSQMTFLSTTTKQPSSTSTTTASSTHEGKTI